VRYFGVDKELPKDSSAPREEKKKPGVFKVGDRVRLVGHKGTSGYDCATVKGIDSASAISIMWDVNQDMTFSNHASKKFEHIPTTPKKKCWHGFCEGERVLEDGTCKATVVGGDDWNIWIMRDDGLRGSGPNGAWTTNSTYLTRLSDEKPREWHGFKPGEKVVWRGHGPNLSGLHGVLCDSLNDGDMMIKATSTDRPGNGPNGEWVVYLPKDLMREEDYIPF
jgi:hypothetical protein